MQARAGNWVLTSLQDSLRDSASSADSGSGSGSAGTSQHAASTAAGSGAAGSAAHVSSIADWLSPNPNPEPIPLSASTLQTAATSSSVGHYESVAGTASAGLAAAIARSTSDPSPDYYPTSLVSAERGQTYAAYVEEGGAHGWTGLWVGSGQIKCMNESESHPRHTLTQLPRLSTLITRFTTFGHVAFTHGVVLNRVTCTRA